MKLLALFLYEKMKLILYEMTFQEVQLKGGLNHGSYDETSNENLNLVLLLKCFLPYDCHSFLKFQSQLLLFLECQADPGKDCLSFCWDPGFCFPVSDFHFQFVVFLAVLLATWLNKHWKFWFLQTSSLYSSFPRTLSIEHTTYLLRDLNSMIHSLSLMLTCSAYGSLNYQVKELPLSLFC